jgi:hypothetical protein
MLGAGFFFGAGLAFEAFDVAAVGVLAFGAAVELAAFAGLAAGFAPDFGEPATV